MSTSRSDAEPEPESFAVHRAVSRSVSRLVRQRAWEQALPDVLSWLGAATSSSRAYYLELGADSRGEAVAFQRCEWTAPGIEPQTNNPQVAVIQITGSGFEEWIEPCFRGHAVFGRTCDFPSPAREFLEAQKIVSVLLFPVLIAGAYLGAIGFDNCVSDRSWNTESLDALQAVADALANSIERDRSERLEKAAKLEAQRQHRELMTILDAVQAEVIYLDTVGRVIRHNRYSQQRTGLTDAEIAGRTVLHKDANWDEPERRHQETLDVIRTGKPLLKSLQWFMVGAEKHWATVDKVPTFDDAGQVNGLLLFIYDVTDRIRAEEQLRQQEAQLAHVGRLTTMGEMAAGIAHEITQPLGAIRHFATACREILDGVSDDRALRALGWAQKIEAEAARTHRIIERIRGFAKHSEPVRVRCQVSELIQETLALIEFDTRRARVIIQHRSPELPLTVSGDRIQIQQVLVNLLRNACDALLTNPVNNRRIEIQTEERDGLVLIVVRDNGPGIADLNLPHVFEAFFTTKSSGMGIGLAVCKKIAETHGGQLLVANLPSGGCEFTLALPRDTEPA